MKYLKNNFNAEDAVFSIFIAAVIAIIIGLISLSVHKYYYKGFVIKANNTIYLTKEIRYKDDKCIRFFNHCSKDSVTVCGSYSVTENK